MLHGLFKRLYDSGDLWGGLAAMLVALPASIAFGVTVYAAISPQHAAMGALAGIIGASVIGLVAAVLGGTDRLISAPCAPAAAVLAAFAAGAVADGTPASQVVLMLLMLGILSGLFQLLFGALGAGTLIRYLPFPVVSGYLTGVGLILIGTQVTKLLGVGTQTHWLAALAAPWNWDLRALAIGAATAAGMVFGPTLTRRVPGPMLGLAAGVATYAVLAALDPALWSVQNNALVVGPLGASGEGYVAAITSRWHEIGQLRLGQVAAMLGAAFTLAALLSIDTLKTAVVLEQLTRTSNRPNRELLAQGIANVASSAVGGMPGAGTMGATLINLSSGGSTRASGLVEGVAALLFSLVLSSVISWIPVAALAAILIVVGVRMIDRSALRLAASSNTVLDFAVVLVVVVVALTVGLIAASVAGVVLAIVLFLREQIGGNVVRHRFSVNQFSSTWHRPESQTSVLAQKGEQALVFQLQGSLFFGTTRQLYAALEPELSRRAFIVLDCRRVLSIDITAAHMLARVRDALHERGALLVLAGVRGRPTAASPHRDLKDVLQQVGLTEAAGGLRWFDDLDRALEWVEDRLLGEVEGEPSVPEEPLQLQDMELFHGRKDETLANLEARMQVRSYAQGERIYAAGEPGNALYLIRRGSVRIFAPLADGRSRHIATFARGDFFGGLSFLDGRARTNDAVASTATECFVLDQASFEAVAEEHKRLALVLMKAMARSLSLRLRYADAESAMLRDE